MNTPEDELARLYNDLASFPSPQCGWLIPSNRGLSKVIAKFSQGDLKNDKGRSFVGGFVSPDSGQSFSPLLPSELVDVHLYVPSPSGKYVAVVRAKANANPKPTDVPAYFIEIWCNSRLLHNISTAGKHAFIYNDEWFGGLEWSPDERRLAYAAEPEPPKTASFWADDTPGQSPLKGRQYDVVEDWGESYQNRAQSRLYVADLAAQTIVAVPGVPDNLSIGQVSWSPDSRRVAYVGWSTAEARRLGIKYCYNRPSAIYVSAIGADVTADTTPAVSVSKADVIARSPRFTPDGRRLVWLASQETRTHNTCSSLRLFDLESQAATTVVDVVDVLPSIDAFPGLFAGLLPSRCFLSENELVLDTQWHSSKTMICVDLRAPNNVRRLHADGKASFSVYDVRPDQVLAVTSSFSRLPQIILGTRSGTEQTWTWSAVSEEEPELADRISKIKWDVVTLGEFPNIYQYTFIHTPSAAGQTSISQKPPLIVAAHGGPHEAFSTEYMQSTAFMILAGFSAIFINYRGSLGFGKALVDALPTHIGSLDVADCEACIKDCLASGKVDPNAIAYIGGSHGGYLGIQLCGRTKYFKAAALRNPVVNLLSLIGSSDIPDWAIVESGASGRADVATLYSASPIAVLDSITTPIMLLVGDSDRRVPPAQPAELHFALKERGVPTAMKVYPKTGHAISKPELEADSYVNAILWFKKYLV